MPVTKNRAILFGTLLGILSGCGPTTQTTASQAAPITISSSQTGTDGGFYYSFWTNNQGSCSMTLDGSNGYSLSWSNVGDFTAGKGWNPGSSNRVVCYSGSYSNSGGGGIGVYGWTKNPLIEYYIVDSPGNSGSPGQGTQVGSVTADGATYTIWKHQQVNQPCITGNTCTFWQYISVRNSRRVGGTITTKTHFDAWAQNNMSLGSHDYQILLTESWSGSGSANVKISNGACSGGGGGGGGGGGTVGGGGGGGTTGPGTAVSINVGGDATNGFVADNYFSGGSTYTNTATVTAPSGVPAAIFNSERYGAFTYTLSGYQANSAWNVTLLFAETYLTAAGQRTFDVALNGTKVLTAYDIFADAGGANIGVAKKLNVKASSSGQIVIDFQTGSADSPKVNGIVLAAGSIGGGGGGVGGGGGGGTVDNQAPSAPSGLQVSDFGTTSVTLNWSPSTDNVGVTGYTVYANGAVVGSSTTSSAQIGNLAPATVYTFTVTARDAAGNVSAASSGLTLTIPCDGCTDLTPPSAPSNLTWNAIGQTVILSWGASTDNIGVVGYKLFYGSFFLGQFTDTSLALLGFKSATPYVFTVKAVDGEGNVSQASNQTTVLLGGGDETTPPSAPGNLTATNVGSTTVSLRWTASSDDVGVVVYQIFSGTGVVGTVPASTSATVQSLAPSTTYTFTVKAVDAAGNVSAPSNSVTVTTTQGTDTTPPSAPTGLTATNVTSSGLTLVWLPSSDDMGVAGYEVYNGSVLVGTTVAARSLSITGLSAGTTYGFTVTARDAAGNSTPSAVFSVTTLTAGGGGGGGGSVGSPIWINVGGAATGSSFVADADFSGGSTYTNTASVTSPSSAVPAEVFQSERYGAFTYTIPGYSAGATWTVTLLFAETYLTSAGQRVFDVSINGTKVLSGFDIYSAAGGGNLGVAKAFSVTANSAGQFVIEFAAGSAENPKVNGIVVTKDPIPMDVGGGGGGGGGGGPGGGGGGGGVATCSSAKVSNVPDSGSPYTGSHKVVVEVDSGISSATIFRPSDLVAGAKYPIVSWGQGGCSLNGTTNPEILGEIASHGYLVIADGTPGNGSSRSMNSDYRALGKPLLDYIGWAINENGKSCSKYYQSLDTTKVATFGWSCGGLMAEGTSGDSRLSTFMLNSSGMIDVDRSIYSGIHTPVLIILGGSGDVAYTNGMNDYQNITNVPIVVASQNVGHGGTYTQDNGGSFAKVDLAWLNWWLKGDTGSTGKGMFAGSGCGLCKDSSWTVQSKNLP